MLSIKSSATNNPYRLSHLLFITRCIVCELAIRHAPRELLAKFKTLPFAPNRFKTLYRPFRLCEGNQKHFLICRRVYPTIFQSYQGAKTFNPCHQILLGASFGNRWISHFLVCSSPIPCLSICSCSYFLWSCLCYPLPSG